MWWRKAAVIALAALAVGLGLVRPWQGGSDGGVIHDYDIIIANGMVVDGTGWPLYMADVGIRGERIAAMGDLSRRKAPWVIDAGGLAVAPGFINPHSHIDQVILEDPEAEASLRQGITTEIVGMDGESPLDLGAFFRALESSGMGINIGALVGQGTIRNAVLRGASRAASAAELEMMKALVRQAMEEGALGMSTGLEYVPGIYAPAGEIIELLKVVAEYDGVYSTHVRNERQRVLEAVDEAISTARAAGVRVNISHLKVARTPRWPPDEKLLDQLSAAVIARVREAISRGQEVSADVYPYAVGWFLINRGLYEEFARYPPGNIYVMKAADPYALGKSLSELADGWGVSPAGAVQRLAAGDADTRVYVRTLSENAIEMFMRAEFSVFSVDAAFKPPFGLGRNLPRVHPRAYGTYPRVLGTYVREKGLLTLEEAVHKMTGKVASIYRLKDRGMLKPGNYADIVVFDPGSVASRAEYYDPERYPVGIEYVIVNGVPVVRYGAFQRAIGPDGVPVGLRPGVVLRRDRSPAP